MSNDSNGRSEQRAEFANRMRSMRRWRIALSVGGVCLGVVLVATGNTVVGLIIGGLAVARLVMFSRFRVAGARPRPDVSATDRQWLRSRARDEMLVASQVIGCPPGDLRAQFQRGRSIADVAAERSVDLQDVTSAITADITAKARDAEHAGTLTPEGAQRINAAAARVADRLVHRRRA